MNTDILPEDAPDEGAVIDNIVDELTEELAQLRADVEVNPELNPTALMAHTLSVRFEKGEIDLDYLRKIVRNLTDRAFVRRAEHLRHYVGLEEGNSGKRVGLVADKWVKDAGGNFRTFKRRVSKPRVGTVFTAHPTFGMSSEASLIMADIAAATDDEALNAACSRLKGVAHALNDDITLSEEHARAQQAVQRLKDALAAFNGALIERAREQWPGDWRSLSPRPMTVASWVGYDLDGRTDIGWQQMVALKLSEKATQLLRYRDSLSAIRSREDVGDSIDGIDRLVTRLDTAIEHTKRCQNLFSGDLDDIEQVADAANALSDRNASGRLTDGGDLYDDLTKLIGAADSDALAQALMVLRAEVDLIGLGTAHIHLRINAVQLQNGLNQMLKQGEFDGSASRLQTTRLNTMIAEADPQSVNMRTLMEEPSTAVRQFILMAQVLKHIDETTPIRFLIAECEHPFTVLIALYFARLFGIDDKIDISPLFETPAALESGARIMEQLLDNERYMTYVRTRGRIAVQTGFSDAGRFIGQIPATLGIERLQVKLARMLGNRGIEGIEVVMFDTHGESIGRGAHPSSLQDRLLYVLSHVARRQFARAGVALKHETSFQGGDGYLFFANDRLARHSALAVLEDALSIDEASSVAGAVAHPAERDTLYDDTDFTLDFFLHLAGYHERLFANPDYRVTLGSFGTNLLYKTGSRKSIRQHENQSAVDRGNPAQMRAIPNNAILQQLGYVANVVSGIGSAVSGEIDRFIQLCENSDRAHRLLAMVSIAKQTSSLNSLSAYSRVFSPGYWVMRAYNSDEPSIERALLRLVDHLVGDPRSEGMIRLVTRLRQDAIDLHSILERLEFEDGKTPESTRLELDLLHAVRIALIDHIFILASRIPPFALRNDVSTEQVMDLVVGLDVDRAVEILRDVFPSSVNDPGDAKFIEEASYNPDVAAGYHDLHERLMDPMQDSYDLVREITIGVSHHFRAHG